MRGRDLARVVAGVWAMWLALGLGAWTASAAAIPLWPGRAPGEVGSLPPESDLTKTNDQFVAGRRLIRLGNVSEPTLELFRPKPETDTGAAVLVCPGGGYHILALDLEGTEVCEWLNSIGVTGVLLKYRVPKRPGLEKHTPALQDAQRALSLLRARSREFGLDPARLGVLGFSAGGHLSAALSTAPVRSYPRIDEVDDVSWRPNFTVLIYPAYLSVKEENDRVAPDLPITTNTPPTFISISADDPVRVEGALSYSLALKQSSVPIELHVYPTGGHGYGLRKTENPVTWWPDRAAEWMKSRGFLRRP